MDLRDSFAIEDPPVSVPWSVTEDQLLVLLESASPRHVKDGYVVIAVRVLGGLDCMLGFHFDDNGLLSELEFFRVDGRDPHSSFAEFLQHFERAFGQPSRTEIGSDGFPSCSWFVPGARIIHRIRYRIGPEEHMLIKRDTSQGGAAVRSRLHACVM